MVIIIHPTKFGSGRLNNNWKRPAQTHVG